MKNSRALGIAFMVLATFFYGMVPSFSFLAFQANVVTSTILFNKYFYSAIVLWAVVFITHREWKLTKENRFIVLFLCVSYIGLASFIYMAYEHISGSLATILAFTYPPMVLAVQMISGREPVRFIKIFSCLLALVGLIIIVWSPEMSINIVGVLAALACALSYVFYTIGLSTKPMARVNSIVLGAYVTTVNMFFNLGRCLIEGSPVFTTGFDQLWRVGLITIATFGAILCFAQGVKNAGPTLSSIINSSEPVIAFVAGYLICNDPITGSMIGGGAMVLIAVIIASLPDKDSKAK